MKGTTSPSRSVYPIKGPTAVPFGVGGRVDDLAVRQLECDRPRIGGPDPAFGDESVVDHPPHRLDRGAFQAVDTARGSGSQATFWTTSMRSPSSVAV